MAQKERQAIRKQISLRHSRLPKLFLELRWQSRSYYQSVQTYDARMALSFPPKFYLVDDRASKPRIAKQLNRGIERRN